MPTPTYTPLATITLTGADGSITFGSIPDSFADLVVTIDGSPSDNSYPVIALRFNGDTANNYLYMGVSGNGSSAGSGQNNSLGYLSLGQAWGTGPSTSSRFVTIGQIMGYSSTNYHKTVLSRNNVPGTGVEAQSSRWASTAAINSVTVITTSGGFATGTVISLFGIAS